MSIDRAVPWMRWIQVGLAMTVLIPAAVPRVGSGEVPAHETQTATSQSHVQRVVRHVNVSPRIGPPGTLVTTRTSLLPALTPVQVVIGATRSGFEELALGQTDADGAIEQTVEVPAWARRDQVHRFLIFNLYFSTVLAESGIFHVTDADGRVVREGEIGSAGAGCTTLTLEGDDGERYRLIGTADDIEAGDRVVIEGLLSESDEGCGEGLSLDLASISIR